MKKKNFLEKVKTLWQIKQHPEMHNSKCDPVLKCSILPDTWPVGSTKNLETHQASVRCETGQNPKMFKFVQHKH